VNVRTLGIDLAKNVFGFMGSTRTARFWLRGNFGGVNCYPSLRS
jgi:hypothetical protein